MDGLADRIILRFDDLLGFVLISRLQARPLAGGFVHAVIHAATAAAKGETVTRIHIFNTRAGKGLSGHING